MLAVAAGAVLTLTSGAHAQLPDSIAWARMDSSSICPAVSVRLDYGDPGGSISMTPITRHIGNREVGFGMSIGVAPGLGMFGIVSFMSMGEGSPRYEKVHEISIVADDSIRLTPSARYEVMPGGRLETIDGRIQQSDLARLERVKRVTLTLGSESYALTYGQVQAIRALVGERNKTLSNREVPTGCVGPSPKDLEYKWATTGRASNTRDSIVFVKGSSVGVADSIVRVGKDGRTVTNPPTYFEFQVQQPARVLKRGAMVYPPDLRANKVTGSVLAQFVVLENGTVDMTTLHVLQSSHNEFTDAVRNVLPQMLFSPGQIDGHPVRQLVQLPFEFRINGVGADTSMITLPSGVLLRRVMTPDSLRERGKETFALPASTSTQVYTESQVDKPVRNPDGKPLPKTVPPEVVEMFGGQMVMEFVVDVDGRVVPGTVKVISATDPAIMNARQDGAGFHFIPAELGGKRVKQIVQLAMPTSKRPAR